MMIHDNDDFGEVATPTLIEMWKHQAVLMTHEADYLNQELVKARQNIATLVAINETLLGQLRSAHVAPAASHNIL